MTESESEIKPGRTSMRILFSAVLNFKMINKTRSVDSRSSLKYSRADKVMSKQKMGTVKTGGGVGRVSMCFGETDSITKPMGMTWVFVSSPGLPLPFSGLLPSLPEKAMATHSSVLAWRIPGTGEPGGLLSMGSHRVGPDWSDLAAAVAAAAAQSTESNLTQTLLHYSLWPSLTNSAYASPWLTHMNLSHTAAAHTSNFLDANFLTVTRFSLFVRTWHFPEIRLLNAHMDGPIECHTGWSKSDRGEILYDIPDMWNLKRNDTNELMYKRETDSQTLRTSLVTGEGWQ